MIKPYNQRFYPNPFRYRKLYKIENLDEIVERIKDELKPFLNKNFSLIDNYIDQVDNLNSEIRIIRIFRNKIKNGAVLIKNKSKLLSESLSTLTFEKDYLKNYQKNLRFLELPIHPKTDKKGFEIQLMSNDIVEDLIEEIDEGFGFVYDYCSKKFPESVDLWNDYAVSNPQEFPFVAHDYFIETSYEVFDRVFDDIQKNSINVVKWFVSGDIKTKIIRVIKPSLNTTKLNTLWIVCESLLCISIFLILFQYIVKHTEAIKYSKKEQLSYNPIKKSIFGVKKGLKIKKLEVQQKFNRLKMNLIDFKINCKYKIVTFLITKTNLN